MKLLVNTFALALLLISFSSCIKAVSGNPEQVTADYIKAIMQDDSEAFFRINHITARRLKYLGFGKTDEAKETTKQQIKIWQGWWSEKKTQYDAGNRWNDRVLFPSGAKTTVGKAYNFKPVGDDPINAEYLKGLKIIVPVDVEYSGSGTVLLFQGKKVASAKFDCILGKIRKGKNVRVYSDDDRWYVTSCLIDAESVKYK